MAHEGGTKVNYGFYWSAKAWDMAMVPAEGGLLPGGSDRHYTRIPTVLFLLMAPMMGALYVVFLPFAGFALVAGHALRALKTLALDTVMHIAVAVSPSWAPGEAYLASRKRAKAERAAARTAGARHAPRVAPGLKTRGSRAELRTDDRPGRRAPAQFGRRGRTDAGWGPGIPRPRRPFAYPPHSGAAPPDVD